MEVLANLGRPDLPGHRLAAAGKTKLRRPREAGDLQTILISIANVSLRSAQRPT